MKKILMMLAMALTVGACNKNDDAPAPAPAQQMTIDGVTMDVKGAVIDILGGDTSALLLSTEHTNEELEGLEEGELVDSKFSYISIMMSGYGTVSDEPVSYTLDFSTFTTDEEKDMLLTASPNGTSAYMLAYNIEGIMTGYTPNLYTDGDPVFIPLAIKAGTMTFSKSGDEIEVKLDVTYTDGKTLKAYYKGTPVVGEDAGVE